MLSFSMWGTLIGVFALEITAIVGTVALANRLTQHAKRQRAFWQAAIVGAILLCFSEVAGLRTWIFRSSARNNPERRLSVALTTSDGQEAAPVGEAAGPSARESVSVTKVRWPGWLWAGGTFMLLALKGTSRIWLALERRKMPVSESEAVTNQLLSRFGFRKVSVRVWNRVKGPVAFGFWRPTIAIPPDFVERFPQEQREVMLAHESAHLVLHDPIWFGLIDMVCAFAWWHPVLWWARRSFRRVCESAADEASALFPAGPTTLAESLVAFGRELSFRGAGNGLGVGGNGSTSELGFRVHALLRSNVQWDRLSACWLWIPRGLAVCLVGFLLLVPVQSFCPWSILEALSSSLQELPVPATPAQPSYPLRAAEQANQTEGSAPGARQTNSVLVKVEFAEVPESKGSAVENLFQGVDKTESTPTTGPAVDLFPVAKFPSQKNVTADRSVTVGQVRLLKTAQYDGLRRGLIKQPGVEWLSPSRNGSEVTSGGEAVAKVSEVGTIVFDVETRDQTLINYKTGEVETGPEARIRPRATREGWHLDVSLRCLEFLGYDDPGMFVPQTRGSGDVWGPAPEALNPLPHFRLRESQASLVVTEGQTAVIRGPLKTDITKTKGGLFRRKTEVKKTSRFYIFVSILPTRDKLSMTTQTGALTSTQATHLAQKLANDKAEILYNCRPFSNGPSAQLVDGFWVWRETRGQGQIDLEAEVKFAKDGGSPSVSVVWLDSRPIF